MPNERQIFCGGVAPRPKGNALNLSIGAKAPIKLDTDELARPICGEPAARFTDLIEIATYVYVADQAVTRGGAGVENVGADWRRRLHFTIAVRDPGFWSSDEVQAALVGTLSFLSEDEYHFKFVKLTHGPLVQAYLPFASNGETHDIEEVVLFSGGIDSLGGAVQEVVCDKRHVALVNHRPTEKLSRRYRMLEGILRDRARDIGVTPPLHIPVRINKHKKLGREYTQRSRSFLYASIAATIADGFGLDRIRFYENGVVSLNLPLSPQVVGAKATRTTHPRVLRGFEKIMSLVAERDFTVQNPFIKKTKTEVVKHIVDHGCGEALRHSTSCTHTWETTKREPHCGTCSQCIDRRFAVLAAGAEDLEPAESYAVDLLVDARDGSEHRTMLASYVEAANEMSDASATDFFAKRGEIARVVNHLPGSPDTVALEIYELYKRHGEQVIGVVDAAIQKNSKAIRSRTLPDTCLVRLVCDASHPQPMAETEAMVRGTKQEPQISLDPFVFRKKGKAWVVRYKGNPEFILLPNKGAAYLHLLIAAQGKRQSAVSMAYEVAREPEKHHLEGTGPRWDKEAETAFRAQLRRIEKNLKKAEENSDEAGIERCLEERRLFADEMANQKWGGKPHDELNLRTRIRKAVSNAIGRAITQIAAYDTELARHFRPPNLQLGLNPIYDPDVPIEWDL